MPAPPAPWWPLAPGVWALAALLLLALALLAWRGVRRWRRNAWRRAALAELARARAAGAPDPACVSALLKRAAIAGAGRESVATLSGEAWLAWLDRGLGGDDFRSGAGRALGDVQYAPTRDGELDVAALCALAERWIRRHRLEQREEAGSC